MDSVQNVFTVVIPQTPELATVGIPPEVIDEKFHHIMHAMTLAKRYAGFVLDSTAQIVADYRSLTPPEYRMMWPF